MTALEADEIVGYRMGSQRICGAIGIAPEEAVHTLGALQAQDYGAALWAIGLRSRPDTTKSDVEDAISKKKIVRTWLMRGTIHFASSLDVRWMAGLLAPRLINIARQRDRGLGLSDAVVESVKSMFYEALKGGKMLSREEMYAILKKCGIPKKDNLGYHMLYRAAWDGLICFGPNDGKSPTFTLLDEWVGKETRLEGDKAVEELALRYFSSHGPATIKDFIWWSGLKASDTKLAISKLGSKLKEEVINGTTYYLPSSSQRPGGDAPSAFLLPAFDEYLLGYSDRSAMLVNPDVRRKLSDGSATIVHSNGMFLPLMVYEGMVIGTWKRQISKSGISVILSPFGKLSREQSADLKEAAESYGRFFESEVSVKTLA